MIKNQFRSLGGPLATFLVAGVMGVLAQPGPSSALMRQAGDTTKKDLHLAAGGRIHTFDQAGVGAADNNADALAIVGTKADLYAFYASAFLEIAHELGDKPAEGMELADKDKQVKGESAVVQDVLANWKILGTKSAVGKLRTVKQGTEELFENVGDQNNIKIHEVKFSKGARGSDRFGYRWKVVVQPTLLLNADVTVKKPDKKPGIFTSIAEQLSEQVTGEFLVDGALHTVNAPETANKK